MRPFLLGKMLDAFRARRAMRRLKALHDGGHIRTAPSLERHLRGVVMPFPSPAWCQQHRGALLGWADDIVAGRVIVYGVNMSPHGWHTDPLSGYTWPATTWFADCLLAKADPTRPRGIDIRIPHEYGRCHHWPALALAAALASSVDERRTYANALRADILDFIERNPPQMGPQWTITTGVAIRAANLGLACDWLRACGIHDEPFEQIVAASLVDHAEHITAMVEWSGGMRTSHYLANMVGMLAIGIYLRGDHRAKQWARQAASALRRELGIQFYDDGMSFEASTGYHRHVLDIMVLAAMLIDNAHAADNDLLAPLDDEWRSRLEASVEALQVLLVRGRIDPAIGDDDDGMAIKLLSYEPDVSWLLDCCSALGLVAPQLPWSYHGLPSFGLHVWRYGRVRTTLRCGPIGQWGKGGHAHNDQLSMTFSVDDIPIVADPGIVCYGADPERRDRDRSTAVHATLAPVGMEQNEWPSGADGIFWMMGDRAKAHVLHVADHMIEAEHVGFGAPHVRRMTTDHDGVVVVDRWSGMPTHPTDIMLPCAPGVDIALHADHAVLETNSHRCAVHWKGAQARVEGGKASQGYGHSTDTVVLCLRATASEVRWTLRVLP